MSTESTRRDVNELRRLTGLTRDQLARLFHASRRTLQFWASSAPLDPESGGRLHRVLAAVRKAGRGSAALNRAMLLEGRDGVLPLDLLAQDELDGFIDVVGVGPGRRELARTPLSPQASDMRRPPPPDPLAGALQDRVHVENGRFVSSTPITRRREARDRNGEQ